MFTCLSEFTFALIDFVLADEGVDAFGVTKLAGFAEGLVLIACKEYVFFAPVPSSVQHKASIRNRTVTTPIAMVN